MDINNKLRSLRKIANENFIPTMKLPTIELLIKYLKEYNPKKVLEIGTSIGISGIEILKNSSAFLTTIEKDENIFLKARENFFECDFSDRTEQILGDCNEILMMMSKKFDFVILDGPKGHNEELTKLILPFLNKNGIIFVDNTNFHDKIKFEGKVPHKHRTIVANMRKFFQFLDDNKNLETTYFDDGDGIAIIKKLK